jgi:hypothetical protein
VKLEKNSSDNYKLLQQVYKEGKHYRWQSTSIHPSVNLRKRLEYANSDCNREKWLVILQKIAESNMNRETMTTWSEVLTEVTIKSIFWDVMPCNLVELNFYWLTWHHIPEDCTLQRNCSFDCIQRCAHPPPKSDIIHSDHLAKLLEEHKLLEKIVTNHILWQTVN